MANVDEQRELNKLMVSMEGMGFTKRASKPKVPRAMYGEEPDDEEENNFGKMSQCTSSDGVRFFPAGHTVPILESGVYEIKDHQSRGHYWEKIPVKTEGLLRFPDGNSEKVIHEIQNFWSREQKFQDFGLTYKRGIILWGPPGSGKSSTIQIIISDVIEREGVVFKFNTAPSLFLEGIRMFREIQPETKIVVLMEDIDSILEDYGESDVLNILDGVDKIEKVVFIACPAPETKILKADLTWVRADSLIEGDELIAFDENGPHRKYRTAKVESCPIIQKPRFKVITTFGEIIVSEKHPFLVKIGSKPHSWRTVEQLRKGMKIAATGKIWETDNSHDGGYLAGQYDGEGNLNIGQNHRENRSSGFRMTWTQTVGQLISPVVQMLVERGFDISTHTTKKKSKKHKDRIDVYPCGGMWENLRLLGTIRPMRLLANHKLKEVWEDCRLTSKYARVISVEAIGEGPVVALDTTTKTFIGEGLLQHNTTNYPELLGDRIINRPSRFDKRYKMPHPNGKSRKIYFEHLFSQHDSVDRKGIDLSRWVKDTDNMSIAHLKELFVAVCILGEKYEDAISVLQAMIEDKITSDEVNVGFK